MGSGQAGSQVRLDVFVTPAMMQMNHHRILQYRFHNSAMNWAGLVDRTVIDRIRSPENVEITIRDFNVLLGNPIPRVNIPLIQVFVWFRASGVTSTGFEM